VQVFLHANLYYKTAIRLVGTSVRPTVAVVFILVPLNLYYKTAIRLVGTSVRPTVAVVFILVPLKQIN
jgi:hypothetical protein